MKIDPVEQASTNARYQAIRKAWKREQQLVWEGKGTRDWTKEQQRDILDLEKGRAYDDRGHAFEGQHMRSAAEYPEDQGNPDNIQFLNRDEHLRAHKGNCKNPTNWYYDPLTDTYNDFGNGQIAPCRIIELSDPVIADGRANFYVIDPLTGIKTKPDVSVRKCKEPRVAKSLKEGRFVRPADLAIAVAYVRLRYSDTGISIESFTKSVKDAGNIVHNCLRFDAIAIPLMNNRKEKYYYSVSDIDFTRLEQSLNPSAVHHLRSMLEINDGDALATERKSAKVALRSFLKKQGISEINVTRIMQSVYRFGQMSIQDFYKTMARNSETYTGERLTIDRNSEIISLDEARKAGMKIIKDPHHEKPSRGCFR